MLGFPASEGKSSFTGKTLVPVSLILTLTGILVAYLLHVNTAITKLETEVNTLKEVKTMVQENRDILMDIRGAINKD